MFFHLQKTIEILSKEEGYAMPDGPSNLSSEDKLKVKVAWLLYNVILHVPNQNVPYQMQHTLHSGHTFMYL